MPGGKDSSEGPARQSRRQETHSSSLTQGSQPTAAPLASCERNSTASVAVDSLTGIHAFGNDAADSLDRYVGHPHIGSDRI